MPTPPFMSWIVLATTTACLMRLLKNHLPFLTLGPRLVLACALTHAAITIQIFSHLLFHRLAAVTLIRWEQSLAIVLMGAWLIRDLRRRSLSAILPASQSWLKKHGAVLFGWLMLVLCFIPLIRHALYYPHGGWDAWSVWNLKARFLILENNDWRRIFDPLLWRSSPHYPLFLPLVIVHHWIWDQTLSFWHPLLNSLLWGGLVGVFLVTAIASETKNFLYAWFAGLLWLSHPLIGTNIISQYADVPLGFWMLASCILIHGGLKQQDRRMLFLGGMCTTLAGFVKSEGLLFALIQTLVVSFNLIEPRTPLQRQTKILSFYTGAAIGSFPTGVFLAIAPSSQTFINGLVSTEHPTGWMRFVLIIKTALREWLNPQWRGLFWFLALSAGLAGRRLFHKDRLFIPISVGLYLAGVCCYYWINTRFEISWWMEVSWFRVITAILPALLFWVFLSLAERMAPSS